MYKNICKYLAIGLIGLALAIPTLATAGTPSSSPSFKIEGSMVLAHRSNRVHHHHYYYRSYGYRYYPRYHYYPRYYYGGYPYYYSPGFSIGIGVGGW